MSEPRETQREPRIDSHSVSEIMGEASARLIDIIAQRAQAKHLKLFLVGGVIRDLLLKQPNLDLDFVLEADAIAFAAGLAADYGGALQSHKPFDTATWTLDATVAEKLSLPDADLPEHLDFARARSESYAYPTALPTVSPSDIEHDLWRRDFSLNALALQLSPACAANKLLDVCGGLGDLERKHVRVLHDRSFIDDPTRILRALRFARRYGFEIEPATTSQLNDALPMLGRITGARVRNEMELILREPKAAAVLRHLQELGAAESMHPAFRVSARLEQRLKIQPETMPRWAQTTADDLALPWNLLLAEVGPDAALAICQRFDMTQRVTRSVVATAKVVAAATGLSDASARPSEIARLLDGKPEVSLLAAWISLAQQPAAQNNVDAYAKRWRHLRPSISGEDLKRLGLPPGPRYKTLLDELRSAWINGDISTLEEESAYLKELLKQDN